MAATEQDVFNLRSDEAFMVRCTVQAVVAAVAVLSEATTVASHKERVIWARKTVENPRSSVEVFFWAIVGNSGVYTKADAPATITSTNLLDAISAALTGLVGDLSAL
jgi:hypothetical protein